MDAKRLITEFRYIASARGGVQQLRELIIYLAIHGELNTGRESNRDAAQKLIDEAAIVQNKLTRARKRSREQQLPVVPESYLAKYPETWIPTRLGCLVHLVSGQHLSEEDQNFNRVGIPYFTGASDFGALHPIVTRWTSVGRAIAIENDVLIAVKGTIGKVNLLNLERAAIGRQLMAVRALTIDPAFLVLVLRSNERFLCGKGVGIAIPGISRIDLLHLIVGIPSRDEQERIVAKVDQLMALCNELEAQQQQRETLCELTRFATLMPLSNCKHGRDCRRDWDRLNGCFDLIFDNPDSVEDLRNSIFRLAATGRLAGHISHASAHEEVVAMVETRKRAIESGQTRESTKLFPNHTIEVDNSFPSHWVPTRLGHITLTLGAGSTPKGGRNVYVQNGIKFLRSQNIWNDGLQLEDIAFIPETMHEKMKGTHVEAGDILLNITGASIGRSAIVPDDWDTANVSQHVAIVRLADKRLNAFVHMWLISPIVQSQIRDVQVGISREGLSMEKLQNFVLYIPPQEERERILWRTNHLSTLCDRLTDQLTDVAKASESLARAAVTTLTGIRSKDKRKMKVPKTELVSTLHVGVTPTSEDQAKLAAILIRNNGELPARTLWIASGLEIDAFYRQLKTEMARGWITQPDVAYMKEVEAG